MSRGRRPRARRSPGDPPGGPRPPRALPRPAPRRARAAPARRDRRAVVRAPDRALRCRSPGLWRRTRASAVREPTSTCRSSGRVHAGPTATPSSPASRSTPPGSSASGRSRSPRATRSARPPTRRLGARGVLRRPRQRGVRRRVPRYRFHDDGPSRSQRRRARGVDRRAEAGVQGRRVGERRGSPTRPQPSVGEPGAQPGGRGRDPPARRGRERSWASPSTTTSSSRTSATTERRPTRASPSGGWCRPAV